MSVPEFDPNAGLPAHLYVKIADHLMLRIEAGDLKAGETIKEVPMAEEYHANRMTMRNAFRVLRERHLITTLGGKGSVILTKAQRQELIEREQGEQA